MITARHVGGGTTVEEYTTSLGAVENELDQVCLTAHEATRRLVIALPERRPVAEQAEWHVRGLAYHLRAIGHLHRHVIDGVASRASAGEPSVVVMHAPEMQELLFEFYAFIVLARITLDQLGRYIAPLFTNQRLSDSLTQILRGTTNCPLYSEHLDNERLLLRYLLDIRDCLVHHRSFATSDNTVAAEKNADLSAFEEISPWRQTLTRISFRRLGGDRVAVNLLLPDTVWRYDEAGARVGLVQTFTYDNKTNLTTQCIEFMKLCTSSVIVALDLLRTESADSYTWTKA